MSKCHHENVVGYFGSWKKNDELFIAMELCDGGSAADIYQDMDKPLEEPEIALICRESIKVKKQTNKITKNNKKAIFHYFYIKTFF